MRVSPYARKRAEELGVDISAVRGTGPAGAVTAADVERATSAGQPPAEPAAAPGTPATDRGAARQRAIGALMERSKREIPHYYLATTIDLPTALACWNARTPDGR